MLEIFLEKRCYPGRIRPENDRICQWGCTPIVSYLQISINKKKSWVSAEGDLSLKRVSMAVVSYRCTNLSEGLQAAVRPQL